MTFKSLKIVISGAKRTRLPTVYVSIFLDITSDLFMNKSSRESKWLWIVLQFEYNSRKFKL